MMASLELSLDEIIANSSESKPIPKPSSLNINRNYRRSFKARYRCLSYRGTRYNQVPIAKDIQEYNEKKTGNLYVTNLDESVTVELLEEYFSAHGLLEKVELNFDLSGNFMGTAEVVFENFSDALHAFNTCNGAMIKGRPLIISCDAITYGKNYTIGLISTSARKHRNQIRYANSGYARRFPSSKYKYERKEPTVEELDAELDSYCSNEKGTESETIQSI